jgi:dienelactone hydrolase
MGRRSRRAAALAAALAGVGSLAASVAPAGADRTSLQRGPGQHPGPDLLYAPASVAPQLENTRAWRAAPILVSGATAYRGGEFLYQDFLYDDRGARATPDPGDPRAHLFSPAAGTYTYPTDPAYASNAADLVELRVRPLRRATAFRLTLNTLRDPARVGATIALGSSATPRPFPHGANATAPAERFLTWHGTTADLRAAGSGRVLTPAPTVRVDTRRRQVELTVPHAAWNPGRETVRMAAGVGLWDAAAGRYLLPQAAASATRPGGAGGVDTPTAFFNVAFRGAEPVQKLTDTRALGNAAWWRDRLQARTLARGDLSALRAEVDFAKLARRVADDGDVPRTGALNRILSSRFSSGDGVDWRLGCGRAEPCAGQLRGRLQPYAVYVPKARPATRFQLTLLLHSLTANYNQFSGSRNAEQFATRGRPSIVITPEGRGPDGFYRAAAAADTFEVWADVARHYRLDPARTSIAGYSMGGFGTFKLAVQFPDLFARAQPTVGALDVPAEMVASLRWVPFLMWNARSDELVPSASFVPAADALAGNRYRYRLNTFVPAEPLPPTPAPHHITLAANDWFEPAARFLGTSRVLRDPPRVTYVRNAAIDFPRYRTTADHAYWVSRIRLRDEAQLGTVDVRSQGFGVGDAPARTTTGDGRLTGGAFGPRAYTSRATTWGDAPRARIRDRLVVTTTNVASLVVDAGRARVTCGARITIRAAGSPPPRVRLVNCPRRR